MVAQEMMRKIVQVAFDGVDLDIQYKDIKNMYLRLGSDNDRVKISAPLGMPMSIIRQFALSKMEWIEQQKAKLKFRESLAAPECVDGAYHEFQGVRYLLKIIESKAPGGRVELLSNGLNMYIRKRTSLLGRQAVLDGWYREQLNRLVPEMIKIFEPRMNVTVGEFSVRKMKSRWGSCNIRTGHIRLSLELAKKPKECLQYVLVHEMVHLLEPSHNKRFYQLMSRYLPDWRERKNQLNGIYIGKMPVA